MCVCLWYAYMCVYVHMYVDMCLGVCVCVHSVHKWRSDDNLRGSILSFSPLSPRDRAQAARLGDLYQLNLLRGTTFSLRQSLSLKPGLPNWPAWLASEFLGILLSLYPESLC